MKKLLLIISFFGVLFLSSCAENLISEEEMVPDGEIYDPRDDG